MNHTVSLIQAARAGDLGLMEGALQNGAYVNDNTLTQNNETPLHLACQNGHLHIVEPLLTLYGADLEAGNRMGERPLHLACRGDHLDVARYLVTSHGANPNITDNRGETPLHCCFSGPGDGPVSLEMVRFLVEDAGTNPEIATAGLGTALHCACSHDFANRPEIVRYLVEHGHGKQCVRASLQYHGQRSGVLQDIPAQEGEGSP